MNMNIISLKYIKDVFLPISRCKRVKIESRKQNLANFLNFCIRKRQEMDIFGSVQLQIV